MKMTSKKQLQGAIQNFLSLYVSKKEETIASRKSGKSCIRYYTKHSKCKATTNYKSAVAEHLCQFWPNEDVEQSVTVTSKLFLNQKIYRTMNMILKEQLQNEIQNSFL